MCGSGETTVVRKVAPGHRGGGRAPCKHLSRGKSRAASLRQRMLACSRPSGKKWDKPGREGGGSGCEVAEDVALHSQERHRM